MCQRPIFAVRGSDRPCPRRSCGRKDGLEDAAYDFPVSADDVVIVRPLRRRAPSRSAAEEKVRHCGIVRRRSDGAKTDRRGHRANLLSYVSLCQLLANACMAASRVGS